MPGPKKLDPAAGLSTPRPQEGAGWGCVGPEPERDLCRGCVCVLGVGQEEGQGVDRVVGLEVKDGAEALGVLAFQAVSGTEELLK